MDEFSSKTVSELSGQNLDQYRWWTSPLEGVSELKLKFEIIFE